MALSFSTVLGAVAKRAGREFQRNGDLIGAATGRVYVKSPARANEWSDEKEPRRFASQLSLCRASKTWGHVFELVRS